MNIRSEIGLLVAWANGRGRPAHLRSKDCRRQIRELCAGTHTAETVLNPHPANWPEPYVWPWGDAAPFENSPLPMVDSKFA